MTITDESTSSAYAVAELLRNSRKQSSRKDYDVFKREFGITLPDKDVDMAYQELYGRPIHRSTYFPSNTVNGETPPPWEMSYSYARDLAERRLLRGRILDGKLLVDEWYIPFFKVVRDHGLPRWYLSHMINEGNVTTKKDGNTLFVRVSDAERIKDEFLREGWMKLSYAARFYRLSRERIRQLTGRSKSEKPRKTAKTIVAGRKTIYVSSRDLENIMSEFPESFLVSVIRARKFLELESADMEIYLSAGMFDEIFMGTTKLLTTRSVLKLKSALTDQSYS